MFTENCQEPVVPCNPPAPYVGGKKLLAKKLAARIAAVPHNAYAEPFIGMGGVFFRRTTAPKAEIINDISGDVATLFRVLQRHYPYFIDFLKFRLCGRKEFDRLKAQPPELLTDLERAARFLYLQKTAFGGKATGRNFAMDIRSGGRFNQLRIEATLDAVNERLAGVIIECLPWQTFIKKYDRAGILFYLDPPYWGNEGDYGKSLFSRADFTAMAELLKTIQGRFILSLNAVPGVRETFRDFDLEEVDCKYTLGHKGVKAVKELIISN